MKLETSGFLTSWKFILLLVVVGVVIRLAVPEVSSLGLVLMFFVVLVLVVFRRVIIQTLANLLGTGRTNTFLFSQEYEKAVEFSTEQIAKNPKDVVAYLTRSTAYIHLGKLEAARADCDTALSLDPKSVYTLNNRAVISMQEDNLAAALADMEKAVTLQPDNPVVLYGRGSVYERMGKTKEALKDYQKAIDIEPEQAISYVGRGQLSFQEGDIEAALDDFQEAYRLYPETHQISAALAVGEFVSGQEAAAVERWRKLPTDYARYTDPDWQRRVLGWPPTMIDTAAKLIVALDTLQTAT